MKCPECGWEAEYVGRNDKVRVVEYRCPSPVPHSIGHTFFIEQDAKDPKRKRRSRRRG